MVFTQRRARTHACRGRGEIRFERRCQSQRRRQNYFVVTVAAAAAAAEEEGKEEEEAKYFPSPGVRLSVALFLSLRPIVIFPLRLPQLSYHFCVQEVARYLESQANRGGVSPSLSTVLDPVM